MQRIPGDFLILNERKLSFYSATSVIFNAFYMKLLYLLCLIGVLKGQYPEREFFGQSGIVTIS
jgi:hypothetical protein